MAGPIIGYEEWQPWQGPEVSGVSYSTLSKFINCRHRTWLYLIQGWIEDRFSQGMHFGELWHACQEDYGAGKGWKFGLRRYTAELKDRYPGAGYDIAVINCLVQAIFPQYLEFWPKRKSVLQEARFRSYLTLPSGRKIKLNGIVDELVKEDGEDILQDNKTKAQIPEANIQSTLEQDLQLTLYLLGYNESGLGPQTFQTCYNIIRKPKTMPHKGESLPAYQKRIAADVEKRPEYYFMRFMTTFSSRTIGRVKRRSIYPFLEQLWDWWEWVKPKREQDPDKPYTVDEYPDPWRKGNTLHCQRPWGVYDTMGDGRKGDYFDYLTRGVTSTMQKRKGRPIYGDEKSNGKKEGSKKKGLNLNQIRKQVKKKASKKKGSKR